MPRKKETDRTRQPVEFTVMCGSLLLDLAVSTIITPAIFILESPPRLWWIWDWPHIHVSCVVNPSGPTLQGFDVHVRWDVAR